MLVADGGEDIATSGYCCISIVQEIAADSKVIVWDAVGAEYCCLRMAMAGRQVTSSTQGGCCHLRRRDALVSGGDGMVATI